MALHKRNISDVLETELSERQTKRQVLHRTYTTNSHLPYPSKSTAPKSVPFQQPLPLLTFSYTPSRVLEFTDSALRYYVDPPKSAELKYGYERWTKRPEEKGRLDGLLKAISRVRSEMDTSGGKGQEWLRDIGVVSWRGVMTKILTAPYEDRDGWVMNIMEVDDTMYFEEHLSDAKLTAKEDMAPHQRLQSYYGYSFESWCTSSTPGTRERLEGHPHGWGGDVDTNVQWCSVVKTKLGDTRMIIGGEVDCVRDNFTGQTSSFVELKTSMTIRGPQDESRFEKKLLKFYFQSFLLGVPEIVVGFRTPSGQISTMQSFKTIQIPRLVRGKPNAWDPLICLDWGYRFLTFLKSAMRTSVPDKDSTSQLDDAGDLPAAPKPHVWRVKFEPRVGVSVSLLDELGIQEVEAGEDRVGFLPKWYWDESQSGTPRSAGSRVEPERNIENSRPASMSAPSIPAGWQI